MFLVTSILLLILWRLFKIDVIHNLNLFTIFYYFTADFNSATRDEPWDRIKVICTQPFRKDVQFGLCFVRVQTADTPCKMDTPQQVQHFKTVRTRFCFQADKWPFYSYNFFMITIIFSPHVPIAKQTKFYMLS